MKRNTRDDIIRATASLMQQKGYFGTGLNDIIKESGAPRGSIYYHFPNGKEEIAQEAVKWTKDHVTSLIRQELGKKEDALSAIQLFIMDSVKRFEADKYFSGVPIAALVLETSSSSDVLKECCHEAFEEWSGEFTSKIISNGFKHEEAERLGKWINSMIQGAFISALAKGDGEPLRNAAEMLPVVFKKTENVRK
ncbi:TetR/AcrR family transcriptional regulator [Corticicoccus populi]|uniref:TetR/AcrR family transcriptional regulator n=1 Tax=Corticicoccus populi TaxID=1812821 RepID=A0ABW5WVM4_9STAP